MKKRILIIFAALVMCAGQLCAQTKSATLNITTSTKYQYIEGFGGTGMNGQWGDVYTQAKVNKLWGNGEGDIGLNIMRVRVNPNENNWGEYGNPIRWARAVNPDVQVFATPWTPPKKYKTQNTDKYQNDFGTWVYPLVEHSWGGQGSNGGAINPEFYDEYADFLERYRQTMASKGCPIDMISIQNESDFTPTNDGQASYESCVYSPTEMAAMCKAARDKVDSSCKIMGPECFGWDEHKYNNKLVTLQDALDNIDVWGNHLYGTNDWTFVQNVTKKTGKQMWMTEFLIDYDDDYQGEFSAEFPMVKSIEQAMKAGYNAYVYYNMLNDFFAVNHGGSDTELWKRAYIFSHYAKYATGMNLVRTILSDATGRLIGGSAYASQTGDTISLFFLNQTKDTTYNVTVGLPFVPEKITQVLTGETVNALKQNVTEKYSNGTRRVKVELLPQMFYTFQFVQNISEEDAAKDIATTPKMPNYGNPLSATQFMADPTSVEYEGRLYVYATNDQQEFDYFGGIYPNSYGKIKQLVCMSTDDLVNWTYHGVIDVKAIAPWISTSWAPSIISRVEEDGLTHFYMYFTNTAAGIGVLTSTSPTGPWTDPLGKALIDKNTLGLGNIDQIIDPGAAIKPDGSEAYLTFGGGNVVGTDLQPGNARIVKLGADLISLDGDIQTISAPYHFEANELNYIGSRWVYSYCTRWSETTEWSKYSTAAAPLPCSIVYMTATDPMADKWSFKGTALPNPGRIGYDFCNNHSHLQKFGNGYYMLYHTTWLEHQLGYSGGYRNLQLSRITVTEGTAKMNALTSTTAAITGVSQLTSARVNPYVEHPGTKMGAIITKDWWMVRGVNFAADGTPARTVVLKVKGSGTVEVRLNELDAESIAKLDFTGEADQEQTIAVELTQEQTEFQNYLYFVFTKNNGADVTAWRFSSLPPEDAVKEDETTAMPGDVNEDGSVDISDIVAVINQIAGTASYRYADVNNDTNVDISDIVAIINIIAGN